MPGVARALYAGAVGIGFLAIGLWFGGAAGRVQALVGAAVSSPDVEVIPGSGAGTPRTISFDGQPARMRRCHAPRGFSVAAVRDHYEEVAKRESTFDEKHALPYLALDQPNGAFVAWTAAMGGRRKGVIVTEDAGQVDYMLVESEQPETFGRDQDRGLVGGITAPAGARTGLSIDEGASGFSFLELPGEPEEAARTLRSALVAAGYAIDEEQAPELEAAKAGVPSRARTVVPFRGKDRRGFAVIAGSKPGLSRATILIR
jgi:hypothetical protein